VRRWPCWTSAGASAKWPVRCKPPLARSVASGIPWPTRGTRASAPSGNLGVNRHSAQRNANRCGRCSVKGRAPMAGAMHSGPTSVWPPSLNAILAFSLVSPASGACCGAASDVPRNLCAAAANATKSPWPSGRRTYGPNAKKPGVRAVPLSFSIRVASCATLRCAGRGHPKGPHAHPLSLGPSRPPLGDRRHDPLSRASARRCCGQGKTDTQLSNPSQFFVCIRTDIPKIRVLPSTVVEHLNVSDDIVSGLLTRGVRPMHRPFAF